MPLMHQQPGYQDYVALVYASAGISGIRADGSSDLLTDGYWGNTKIALQCGASDVLALTSYGTYRTALGLEPESVALCNVGWGLARAAFRTPARPGSALVLHDFGTYRMDVATGAHEKLDGGTWMYLRAVVHDPSTGRCYAFLEMAGLWEVSLEDGSSRQICGGIWKEAYCAAYAGDGHALVFTAWGMHRVRLADGESEQMPSVGFGEWSWARGAVELDLNRVLVVTMWSIYLVEGATGEAERLSGGNWTNVGCVTGLGPRACSSVRVHDILSY